MLKTACLRARLRIGAFGGTTSVAMSRDTAGTSAHATLLRMIISSVAILNDLAGAFGRRVAALAFE